jgi:hypothetical protein
MSCLLLSLALVFGSFDAPTQSGFSVAINVAGKQRMLSQKMTKEYLLYALQVDGDKNLANAKATMAQFEENAKVLANGDKERNLPAPPNQAIREQLAKVATQWTGVARRTRPRHHRPGLGAHEPGLGPEAEHVRARRDEQGRVALRGSLQGGRFHQLGHRGQHRRPPGACSRRRWPRRCASSPWASTSWASARRSRRAASCSARSLTGLIEGDAELGLPPLKSDSIRRQLGKVQELWKSFEPLLDQAAGGSSVAPDLLRQVAELNPQLSTR